MNILSYFLVFILSLCAVEDFGGLASCLPDISRRSFVSSVGVVEDDLFRVRVLGKSVLLLNPMHSFIVILFHKDATSNVLSALADDGLKVFIVPESAMTDRMTKDQISSILPIYAWDLTQFDRIVYLDPFSLVEENIVGLFSCEGLCFSSKYSQGTMVLEPSKATFKRVLSFANEQSLKPASKRLSLSENIINSYASSSCSLFRDLSIESPIPSTSLLVSSPLYIPKCGSFLQSDLSLVCHKLSMHYAAPANYFKKSPHRNSLICPSCSFETFYVDDQVKFKVTQQSVSTMSPAIIIYNRSENSWDDWLFVEKPIYWRWHALKNIVSHDFSSELFYLIFIPISLLSLVLCFNRTNQANDTAYSKMSQGGIKSAMVSSLVLSFIWLRFCFATARMQSDNSWLPVVSLIITSSWVVLGSVSGLMLVDCIVRIHASCAFNMPVLRSKIGCMLVGLLLLLLTTESWIGAICKSLVIILLSVDSHIHSKDSIITAKHLWVCLFIGILYTACSYCIYVLDLPDCSRSSYLTHVSILYWVWNITSAVWHSGGKTMYEARKFDIDRFISAILSSNKKSLVMWSFLIIFSTISLFSNYYPSTFPYVCIGNDGMFFSTGNSGMSHYCDVTEALEIHDTNSWTETFSQNKVCISIGPRKSAQIENGYFDAAPAIAWKSDTGENIYTRDVVTLHFSRLENAMTDPLDKYEKKLLYVTSNNELSTRCDDDSKFVFTRNPDNPSGVCLYNPSNGVFLSALPSSQSQCLATETWNIEIMGLSIICYEAMSYLSYLIMESFNLDRLVMLIIASIITYYYRCNLVRNTSVLYQSMQVPLCYIACEMLHSFIVRTCWGIVYYRQVTFENTFLVKSLQEMLSLKVVQQFHLLDSDDPCPKNLWLIGQSLCTISVCGMFCICSLLSASSSDRKDSGECDNCDCKADDTLVTTATEVDDSPEPAFICKLPWFRRVLLFHDWLVDGSYCNNVSCDIITSDTETATNTLNTVCCAIVLRTVVGNLFPMHSIMRSAVSDTCWSLINRFDLHDSSECTLDQALISTLVSAYILMSFAKNSLLKYLALAAFAIILGVFWLMSDNFIIPLLVCLFCVKFASKLV